MKITICLLLISGVFLVACGSDVRVSDPEDIGEQVMDILEDMDDMSKEDFREEFMTVEDIRELGQDEDLIKDEKGRNRLTKITKSDRDKDLDKSFTKIVERGTEYGIKWSDIEFEDFAYEVETKRGVKMCEGKLTFKHNNASYELKSISIYDGSGYCLVQLRGPYD